MSKPQPKVNEQLTNDSILPMASAREDTSNDSPFSNYNKPNIIHDETDQHNLSTLVDLRKDYVPTSMSSNDTDDNLSKV